MDGCFTKHKELTVRTFIMIHNYTLQSYSTPKYLHTQYITYYKCVIALKAWTIKNGKFFWKLLQLINMTIDAVNFSQVPIFFI